VRRSRRGRSIGKVISVLLRLVVFLVEEHLPAAPAAEGLTALQEPAFLADVLVADGALREEGLGIADPALDAFLGQVRLREVRASYQTGAQKSRRLKQLGLVLS
jgi:hypothetical protein